MWPPKVWRIILSLFAVAYALFIINLMLRLHHKLDPQLEFPESEECNLFEGKWVQDLHHRPLYGVGCPFIRKEWNCYHKNMSSMSQMNSWRWVPGNCSLPRFSPQRFLRLMRNKVIGFVGDSVIENFMVSLICNIYQGDNVGGTMWEEELLKRAYFPMFNVSVFYYNTTFLATYEYDELVSGPEDPLVKMDVDLQLWFDAVKVCDVLVFNCQHEWIETSRFYEQPPFLALTGRTISYFKKGDDIASVKFWLTPSPIYNDDDCESNEPLDRSELGSLRSWRFDENYQLSIDVSNHLEEQLVHLTKSVKLFNVSLLSELRGDAHVEDCTNWCLPGLPDTWVDILSYLLERHFKDGLYYFVNKFMHDLSS